MRRFPLLPLLWAGSLALGGTAEWTPFVIPLETHPDSEIAIRDRTPIPVHGPRLIAREGHFYREGRRFRIWGVNLSFGANFPTHADAEKVAERLAAVGLNSGLPGERDVLEQLRASHRLASQAGTAGPFANGLIEDVLGLERRLRESTKWGEYHPEYAYAAMSRLISDLPFDLRDSRILVIGGSTTSASVLRTLTDRFQVPSRQLTLVYRGHKKGGQIKILRRAIGHGQRIRVQTYRDAAVERAISEADVVVFGLDQDTPILDAQRVAERGADHDRPLTIFDFNVFGSTEGLESLRNVNLFDAARLEREAAAYADELCRAPGFNEAVEQAEAWIVEHALSSKRDERSAPVYDEMTKLKSEVLGTVGAVDSSSQGDRSTTAIGEEASCQP